MKKDPRETVYGKAAIDSRNRFVEKRTRSLRDAWMTAVGGRNKSCPRDTFLGLCGEGIVKGIEKGNYTRSMANREYAINAVRLLRENPNLARDPMGLWDKVARGVYYNGQMHVVVALWNEDLIQKT